MLFAYWFFVGTPVHAAAGDGASDLLGYSLYVAGAPAPMIVERLQQQQGVPLIPLKPVADRLMATLEVDPNNRTIRVIRADDHQELFFDAKTGTLTISGFSQGIQDEASLVQITPTYTLVPQSLLERLFNVFVVVDPQKKMVEVNPNSQAFAEALAGYQEEQKTTTEPRFRLPRFRLNALQYDTAMNENSTTRFGQLTTLRTTGQIGNTVFNAYNTYVGSSKGPSWRYSLGGVQILPPKKFNIQIGDYPLRTGTIAANGINRGVIAEKAFGQFTRVGLSVGGLQSRLINVGIQVQRPLFLRNQALAYAVFDTDDFKEKSFFKTGFWRQHRLTAGTGIGGFADQNNPSFHARGYLGYLYLHDQFTRFGGRWKSTTDLDLGYSQSKDDTTLFRSAFHDGNVFVFKQNSTFFNKITVSTLAQRGSPNWSTLDISNTYRNQFVFTQAINWQALKGMSLFVSRSVNRPTRTGPKDETKVWSSGAVFNFLPGYLPELSFNSSVQTKAHTKATYFNTLFFNQPLKPLRTQLSGQWLFSNTGPENSFTSAFGLNTRTTLFRGVTAFFSRQWTTPETINTQTGLDTGRLFGQIMKLNFGIGQIISPTQTVRNMSAGMSVYIRQINQRASVNFSKFNENFQLAVNFSGLVGRRGTEFSSIATPIAPVIPTGSVTGRFFIDKDLSGTFDPAVDTPMPNLKVIASNRVIGLTDAAGKYHVKNLPRGFLNVTTDVASIPASLAFLTPSSQDTFVLPNHTKVVDFRFGKFGRLRGTIETDSDTRPDLVRDIRLFLENTDRDTLTNDDGSFSISDIVPGKYVLKIDPDYVPSNMEVVNGTVMITVLPESKLTVSGLQLRLRRKETIEKHF